MLLLAILIVVVATSGYAARPLDQRTASVTRGIGGAVRAAWSAASASVPRSARSGGSGGSAGPARSGGTKTKTKTAKAKTKGSGSTPVASNSGGFSSGPTWRTRVRSAARATRTGYRALRAGAAAVRPAYRASAAAARVRHEERRVARTARRSARRARWGARATRTRDLARRTGRRLHATGTRIRSKIRPVTPVPVQDSKPEDTPATEKENNMSEAPIAATGGTDGYSSPGDMAADVQAIRDAADAVAAALAALAAATKALSEKYDDSEFATAGLTTSVGNLSETTNPDEVYEALPAIEAAVTEAEQLGEVAESIQAEKSVSGFRPS